MWVSSSAEICRRGDWHARLLYTVMAHVNDMLAVGCHNPLLESSIAPIARVRTAAFRMNTPQTNEET
jgi:hypothetical protein